jgi:hypothetical protein
MNSVLEIVLVLMRRRSHFHLSVLPCLPPSLEWLDNANVGSCQNGTVDEKKRPTSSRAYSSTKRKKEILNGNISVIENFLIVD